MESSPNEMYDFVRYPQINLRTKYHEEVLSNSIPPRNYSPWNANSGDSYNTPSTLHIQNIQLQKLKTQHILPRKVSHEKSSSLCYLKLASLWWLSALGSANVSTLSQRDSYLVVKMTARTHRHYIQWLFVSDCFGSTWMTKLFLRWEKTLRKKLR